MTVNGTVNDLAMSGARPLYLSAGFILEEGFPVDDLKRILVADEGKLLAIVSGKIAEALVARMRENPYGRDACIIGEVNAEPQGIVAMVTGFGGTRIVDMLVGEQLPRIC